METSSSRHAFTLSHSNRTVSGWKLLPGRGCLLWPNSNRTVSGWKRAGQATFRQVGGFKSNRIGMETGSRQSLWRSPRFKSNRIGMETVRSCQMSVPGPFKSNRIGMETDIALNRAVVDIQIEPYRDGNGVKYASLNSGSIQIEPYRDGNPPQAERANGRHSNRTVSGWKLAVPFVSTTGFYSNRTVSGWKLSNTKRNLLRC